MLVLLLALVLQQPLLTVQVDRDDVAVGATLAVTIEVSTSGSEPVSIADPELQGLEVIDRREQTRVSMKEGVPLRVTTRLLTLRALRAGSALIGAVTVRQRDAVVESEPLVVTIRRPFGSGSDALTPSNRARLSRIAPPDRPPDEVALTVVRSSDAIVLGEQVDILVVAWFPRSVRERLRQPPTLEAPNVRGAWVYARPAPTDVALSRRVAGRWYDLFVLHQIVFPLTAGELEVGPASVSYSVPLSTSFLSRELRRENRSEPSTLRVEPLPPAPDGTPFGGAAGEGLAVSLDASSTELRSGDATVVRIQIGGRGNVSLWPEPDVRWPVGLRAYRQDVSVEIAIEDERIGGSKTYEYLVVADSAGRHLLPAVTYRYFDPVARRYRDATTQSVTFASAGEANLRSPLRSIAPLMDRSLWSRIRDGAAVLPAWVWVLVVVLTPVAAVAGRYRQRLRVPERRQGRRRDPRSGLVQSDAHFAQVLANLVPAAIGMSGGDLEAALRAAGIESSLAAHAAQVRDRLRQALYGPEGAADTDELAVEAEEVVGRLHREVGSVGGRAVTVASMFVLAAASLQPAAAQSAEQLYTAGATRIAADSFAARAAAEPRVVAHWFNLGNTYERLDAPTRARAAWLRAARLAPRDGRVRNALRQTPSPDRVSDRLTWLSPVTPGEAAVGALGLWALGWLLFAMRVRLRMVLVILGSAGALGAYVGFVSLRYQTPVALVVREGTPLRAAPYGSATPVDELQTLMAVRVERQWGPWRLVSRGERSGWLLETEMVGI